MVQAVYTFKAAVGTERLMNHVSRCQACYSGHRTTERGAREQDDPALLAWRNDESYRKRCTKVGQTGHGGKPAGIADICLPSDALPTSALTLPHFTVWRYLSRISTEAKQRCALLSSRRGCWQRGYCRKRTGTEAGFPGSLGMPDGAFLGRYGCAMIWAISALHWLIPMITAILKSRSIPAAKRPDGGFALDRCQHRRGRGGWTCCAWRDWRRGPDTQSWALPAVGAHTVADGRPLWLITNWHPIWRWK